MTDVTEKLVQILIEELDLIPEQARQAVGVIEDRCYVIPHGDGDPYPFGALICAPGDDSSSLNYIGYFEPRLELDASLQDLPAAHRGLVSVMSSVGFGGE